MKTQEKQDISLMNKWRFLQTLKKKRIPSFVVALTFSIILAIIVLRGILFVPGRLDTGDLSFLNDISWYRQEHSWADIVSLPYIHQHYIILYPLSWLVNDVGNLAHLTYFVIFVLMTFTSFMVVFAQTKSKCKRIESCYAAAFTASAIYTLNPYVLGLVGWFWAIFGYAILPLLFYFTSKIITTPSRLRAVQYALISALVLSLELVQAYEFTVSLVFCLLIILTLTIIRIREKPKESLLRFSLSAFTTLILPALLGAFILLPSFVLGGTVIPYAPLQLWQFYAPGWANFELFDVFRLWKWSLEGVPMDTNVLTMILSLIVPVSSWLFLIATLLKKQLAITINRTQKEFRITIIVKEWLTAIVDQDVKWIILIISIVGTVFAMGVSGPLGPIIVWASFNIPFASFKRTEFWIRFLSLSYSLLCGFLVAEICERKQDQMKAKYLLPFGNFNRRPIVSKTVIFLVFILVMSTSFVGPNSHFQIVSGNFGRLINPAKVPSSYDELNQWFSSQEGEFRTLWLPFGPPTWAAESMFNFPFPIGTWLSSRPVVIAHQPNERDYMSFSLKSMGKDELPNFLGLFSVKYIVFHNDTIEDYEANRITYQNLIQNNELELVYQRDFLYVFRNKQFRPYVTSFNSKILAISSLRALNLSYSIPEFSLRDQAIIFAEQYVNLTNQSMQILQRDDILLFYGRNFTDFVLSNLDPRYTYAPLDYMKYNIDYWSAETKGTEFNYDFSYGKGVIFSNTNGLRFNMDVEAESSANYQIWMRFYAAPSTGGEIEIFIDDAKIGSVDEDIQPSESGFIWTKITEYWLTEGRHKLTLVNRNSDKIPNINLITVVPSAKMKDSWNALLDVIWKSNLRLIYVLNETDLKISDPRSLQGSITMVYIPRNGDYMVAVRTTGGLGKANITFGIDLEQIEEPTYEETFQNLTSWYFLLRNLTEGPHNLTVFIKEPENIKSIVVFSVNNSSLTTLSDVFKDKEASSIMKYEKVSSEKWIVDVNTSRPFILAFSEPYYDLWQASVEGTTFKNFPLFSQINGYFINKSGKYVVQINFTLQKFLRDGLIISGTTLSLTTALLVSTEYIIRKRSRIKMKHILLYGLEHLINAGIKEIGVELGPIKEGVIKFLGDGSKFGVKITYIDQPKPGGLRDLLHST